VPSHLRSFSTWISQFFSIYEYMVWSAAQHFHRLPNYLYSMLDLECSLSAVLDFSELALVEHS